jgi:hypothetical protein
MDGRGERDMAHRQIHFFRIRTFLSIRTFAPRRMGNVRQGARRNLPDGTEERSNEGWPFTDKWGSVLIVG